MARRICRLVAGFLRERHERNRTLFGGYLLIRPGRVLDQGTLDLIVPFGVTRLSCTARDCASELEPDPMDLPGTKPDALIAEVGLLEEVIDKNLFLAIALTGNESRNATAATLNIELNELTFPEKAVHAGIVIPRRRRILRPRGLSQAERTYQQSRRWPKSHSPPRKQ